MNNQSSGENIEYEITIELNNNGYLSGSSTCNCGNNRFTIKKDNSYKTTNLVWRNNYNSFFDYLSKISLNNIYEVIKCFTCYNFNKIKSDEYLKNETNIII